MVQIIPRNYEQIISKTKRQESIAKVVDYLDSSCISDGGQRFATMDNNPTIDNKSNTCKKEESKPIGIIGLYRIRRGPSAQAINFDPH